MNTSTQNLIVLKELGGNAPTHLNPLQELFAPHIHALTMFWIFVWCATALILVVKLTREYLAHRARMRQKN